MVFHLEQINFVWQNWKGEYIYPHFPNLYLKYIVYIVYLIMVTY